MTRIVINLCLDQIRRQKRQRAESIEAMEEEGGGVERQMPVVTSNPTEHLEREELRKRIDRALDQLSSEHRTALVLHEFEELEYKEIAKRMGCSIGTVMPPSIVCSPPMFAANQVGNFEHQLLPAIRLRKCNTPILLMTLPGFINNANAKARDIDRLHPNTNF